MFSQHLLLTKIVNEGTRQDWGQISLVARDYAPLADSSSELDWPVLLEALGDSLSFQKEQPQAIAANPDWLRKPASKSVTDFPELTTHA